MFKLVITEMQYANEIDCGSSQSLLFSAGLYLERARGPEARSFAVGPAHFASCGPGWPAHFS